MIIKVDKKGEDVIQQLCDLALKQGGIQNLNSVNTILNTMEVIPEPEPKKSDKPKEN